MREQNSEVIWVCRTREDILEKEEILGGIPVLKVTDAVGMDEVTWVSGPGQLNM
jgi:hypothetical protein